MQKPITLIREEFAQNMVSVVNRSGLPFFIMEPIVKDLLESIQDGARRQAEADQAAYSEYMQKEAEKAQDAADNAQPSETEG